MSVADTGRGREGGGGGAMTSDQTPETLSSKGLDIEDLRIARLLDVLGQEAVLGMLTAVKQGELALLLRLQRQGAASLACVLAAVHKHHCLVPLLQAVCHLHRRHTHTSLLLLLM